MTDPDRKRLAAILGMLGSNSAGERDAAALQAEAFRRRHGLTWAELINGKTVYLGGNPPWHSTPEPPPAKPPEPPAWVPPKPEPRPTPAPAFQRVSPIYWRGMWVIPYALLPWLALCWMGWVASGH